MGAQSAVQQLEMAGISRQNIDISSGSQNPQVSNSGRSTDNSRDEGNPISNFFKSLFGSDTDDADRYSSVAQHAKSIVTVHAQSDDQAERAADMLDDCGAIDVDERASEYGYEKAGYSKDNERGRTSDDDTTMSRMEENLEVGKREVETGGIRVRSRIVERTNVDRPVSGDELSNFQERDIELTERSEVPVVNKEVRVVEEIRISKDVEEREETVRDTVRNTDVDIENIKRENINDTNNDDDLNTGRMNRNL